MKKTIFQFQKNRFYGALRKTIFSVSKKIAFQGDTKKGSFRFRKLAFQEGHENATFSVSEKSLFQGSMVKRFFPVPKNCVFRASRKSDFFSVTEKVAF